MNKYMHILIAMNYLELNRDYVQEKLHEKHFSLEKNALSCKKWMIRNSFMGIETG